MERKILEEGAKGQIRHIVDGLDYMSDDEVMNEILVALADAKARNAVPSWLEAKVMKYAVKYHHERLGTSKPTPAALAKPHWLVKFTRRGMEPPLPFGHTSAVVCARYHAEAIAAVPASPNYPITAGRTDRAVTFPYHCHCVTQEVAAAGGKRRHASLASVDAEVRRLLRK
jgi:hypothetical protein